MCICKGDGMYGMECSDHPRDIVRHISTRSLGRLPLGLLNQISLLSTDVAAGFSTIRVGAVVNESINHALARIPEAKP